MAGKIEIRKSGERSVLQASPKASRPVATAADRCSPLRPWLRQLDSLAADRNARERRTERPARQY
jgi:hypothetical protein